MDISPILTQSLSLAVSALGVTVFLICYLRDTRNIGLLLMGLSAAVTVGSWLLYLVMFQGGSMDMSDQKSNAYMLIDICLGILRNILLITGVVLFWLKYRPMLQRPNCPPQNTDLHA